MLGSQKVPRKEKKIYQDYIQFEKFEKKKSREKIEGNKRLKKLKNKFKINNLFLYNISNLFHLFNFNGKIQVCNFITNFNFTLFN